MTAGLGTHRGTVHQLVFAFTGSAGGAGMGVAASSFDKRSGHHEKAWYERLRSNIRLPTTRSGSSPYRPKQAFSYFEYDDGLAALLRRVDQGGGGPGRNNSHALVGAKEDLNPWSVCLEPWPGWLDEPPRLALEPVSSAELEDVGRVQRDRLREVSIQQGDRILPLLVPMLRDPVCRIAVLGADAGEIMPILWLLHEVIEPAGIAPWTFSTYETGDSADGPRGVSVAFLSAPDEGHGNRIPVWIGDTAKESPYKELARGLLARYFDSSRGGHATGYRDQLSAQVVNVLDRSARIRRVADWLGQSRPSVAEVRSTSEARDPIDREFGTAAPAVALEQVANDESGVSDPAGSVALSSASPDTADLRTLYERLRALWNIKGLRWNPEYFRHELDKLRSDDFLVPRISDLPNEDRRKNYSEVLGFLEFGFRRLEPRKRHAARMIRHEIQTLVTDAATDRMFVYLAYEQARHLRASEQFKTVLGERWLSENPLAWKLDERPGRPPLVMLARLYLATFKWPFIVFVVMLVAALIVLLVLRSRLLGQHP